MLWWKHVLTRKLQKNSNLIQAKKNQRMSDSECYPKADFSRKPNFPNSTHDMIIVKWHLLNFSESRICPNIYRMFTEYLPNVPKCGLNTRHDIREDIDNR